MGVQIPLLLIDDCVRLTAHPFGTTPGDLQNPRIRPAVRKRIVLARHGRSEMLDFYNSSARTAVDSR